MKFILPIVVLAIAGLVSFFIVKMKPEPERQQPVPQVAAVEVAIAEARSVPLTVQSQGTVQPSTQTVLTPEVSGRVIEVSRNFKPGGFFRKGEVLLRIDPVDYEALLAQEQANLAQAELALEQEKAQAEQAAIDWEQLGEGNPSPLALREPQIRQAEAALASAAARVERARRDLQRTEVIAPYDGRVLEQSVDLGGYVSGNAGSPVATIYSIEAAEVRLPVTDDQLARLELPFAYDGQSEANGPAVVLRASTGQQEWSWQGEIVRTEASIDARSRLAYVVAEVEKPYMRDPAQPGRPPLKVGMFVAAEIAGRVLEEAVVLPHFALRENETVLIARPDDTLTRRTVNVAQTNENEAIIAGGIDGGERVIVSPLEYAIEGMALKPMELSPER